MTAPAAHPERRDRIRALFEEYIAMYASRDDRLTERFSEDFTGFTGGGDFLVKDRAEWVRITRQDFAQVPGRIRIEMLDLSTQDLSETVVMASACFHIHLPVTDHILSREVARLTLVFREEGAHWKIVHSGISIPYPLVRDGEVYPIKGLEERNRALEALVEERTHALHESQALYRQLTEDTMDVHWKADRDLRITYISPADERLRGYTANEVVGCHVYEMFTEEGVATVKQVIRRSMAAGPPGVPLGFQTFEVPHRCRDGRVLWGEVMSKPDRDAQGRIVGYHGITREITARKLLEDRVRELAFHDALTGLPNRRLLLDRLAQALAAGKRSGLNGALMFLDLDQFKALNDAHGHEAGDLLLIEAAARLKACVREMDTVARFGGDEFVILLGNLDANRAESTTQAARVAATILAALGEPYRLAIPRDGGLDAWVEHRCTASIGIVGFAQHDTNPHDILKWADAAMYRAKGSGREAIRFHEEPDRA